MTSAYTDSSGAYQFAGLANVTYTVAFAPSYWPTLKNDWASAAGPA